MNFPTIEAFEAHVERITMPPLCRCGCGGYAAIIADVVIDGVVDCREPWVDIEHALGACYADSRVSIKNVEQIADQQQSQGAEGARDRDGTRSIFTTQLRRLDHAE
jgi:hypothetical protein